MEGDVEMSPQRSVVLDFLGYFESGINLTVLFPITKREGYLFQNKTAFIDGFQTRHNQRGADVDAEIERAVHGPYWGDGLRYRAVVGDLSSSWPIGESRDGGTLGGGGAFVVSEELADDKLDEEEDTDGLDGLLDSVVGGGRLSTALSLSSHFRHVEP